MSHSILHRVRHRVLLWGSFVKFSHTIFALPFALGMFVLLTKRFSVSWRQFLFIVLCLVAARTAAMAFNRIIDRHIDARNPRTARRELPAGTMSLPEAMTLFFVSSILFVGGASLLGRHCFFLAFPVLLVLCGYSYAKRFTGYSHLLLGFALALAPGGVWFAITDSWSLIPLPLMGVVLFWVAGFDILYSCQDEEFDRSQGLYSLPAVLGLERAFLVARMFHFVAVILLVLFGVLFDLSAFYYIFCVIFAWFLFRQHRMLSPKNLERIDAAFFTQNGLASIAFFLATIIEALR